MKKIVTIIGARPQLIKTALLSRELRNNFEEIIVHTGQHYDLNMSDIFYKDLNLPEVNYNLGVGSGPQGRQTGMMMEKIEGVLLDEKPDLVLVYGDTNSTVAGALAATKLHIPVGHIEAGMRSFNRHMPEEINRIMTDHISDLLFCSTESAISLLKAEGITKGVSFVGDVMFDLQKTKLDSSDNKILKELSLETGKYLFVTIHRQENTDNPENLKNIFKAFEKIKDVVVYPIHPRTRRYITEYNMVEDLNSMQNLRIIDPVSYTETVTLEKNARLVVTDSGGVQKEAYVAEVPCITLRQETEWTETVEFGWNHLVGADTEKIIKLINNFPKPEKHPNFLGDGQAYKKITQIIKDFLN